MASHTMTTRVAPGALRHRLDAAYYAPWHLLREQQLMALGVELPAIGDLATLVTDGTHKTPNYTFTGIPFLSATNVREGGIWFGDHKFVTESEFAQLRTWNCAPLPGDVLVAKSGSIGNSAVVPQAVGDFAVFESVAIVRSEDFEPYFLSTFLNSRAGQMEIARQTKGSVIHHLHLEDLRNVVVPRFAGAAQTYIGSKVRQAEALRARARELVDHGTRTFGPVHRMADARRKSWRVASPGVSDERLDTSFHGVEALALGATLCDAGAVPVGTLATEHRAREFDPSRPITYFEIGGVDVATGCVWPEPVPANEAPSRAQRSVRPWDILVATVRPERKNVGMVPEGLTGQLVASSGFSVLRCSSAEMAAFLWMYLRSDAGTEQLLRWNSGAAYPAIDDDVPLKVLIPEYPAEKVLELGRRWKDIPALLLEARLLVQAARLLVEGLIERRVSEAELIEAGRDPTADRALLSRLRTAGLDAAGRPLFPDVDAHLQFVASLRVPT